MNINDMLLTPNMYSRPQYYLKAVSGIVVHYVGNPGSTALANRNYFEGLKNSGKTYASSHYIIGLDGEIIRCVPENEVAYCSNSRNYDTLSIENCHQNADGKFNDKTYDSLVELCADICSRYMLDPLTQIIRHYDVTGKKCPIYYVNNEDKWSQFKNDVATKIKATDIKADDAFVAIRKLVELGVIATPDYWYDALKSCNYLDAFLVNASGKCIATNKKVVTTVEAALPKLVAQAIINTPAYWSKAATVVKYLDVLIISVANHI